MESIEARIDSNTFVTKGSMTSDSSYVIMAKEGIDLHLPVDRLVSMTFDAGRIQGTRSIPFGCGFTKQRIDNLRPMTRAQFTQHEYRKQAKKYMVGIDQYDLDGNFIQTFDNCRMAKLAIGDAKDDPSLGIHIRDKSGPQRIRVWRTRPQLDFGVTIRYQITSLSYKHT
jgi:hypothetical protein